MCNEIVGFILSVQSVHKTTLCNLVSEMQWWKYPHHFKSPTSLQHEKGRFKKKKVGSHHKKYLQGNTFSDTKLPLRSFAVPEIVLFIWETNTMAPWVIMRQTWPTSHCFNACSLPTLLTMKCTNSKSFLSYSSQTWKGKVSSVWSKLAFS